MTEMSPAEEIFFAALEKATPGERAVYLDEACADQPQLRARVDKLLAAHPRVGGFLESDAHGAATAAYGIGNLSVTSDHPTASTGGVVAGKYRLRERIGDGGMGSVWLADQTEPVKRKVAVKLIKAGMDSKQVLARFEAERQALAMMDHPSIAKVLDGGLHDNRPYFVMELVKGVPITEYCDAKKLTPKERLELFVPVCQAIQHAHQKGIIHRDIKPSNVLIALYDDKPVPKVIDFGVAKATGGALTESTIDTAFGGVVGTPQYMSPEQATFNNLDIDTRSDVYSLGVLLYELLAGSPPFAKEVLEKRGLLEILRIVREEEPPRPSTKLSTANALPSLSANRGTEPKKLTGLLRNELDWIVMKSLEKDRTRRYETANGFAADINRYLSGEPVQAHPPGAGYRFKKFLQKHHGPAIAASVVFLALVAGIVGTSLSLLHAQRAKEAELIQRQRAEAEAKTADEERAKAQNMHRVAEHRAASVSVDAALREVDHSRRDGLLRLAEAIAVLPADAKALRQNAVMNLLVAGQQIAPVYPAIRTKFHAVSPDGRIGLNLNGGNWYALDLFTGQQLAQLGPEDSAFSDNYSGLGDGHACFSRDGASAATVHFSDRQAAVRIWSTSDWSCRVILEPTRGLSRAVDLNADGSRAATISIPTRPDTGRWEWSRETQIDLWDVPGARRVTTLDHGPHRAFKALFDPTGRALVTLTPKSLHVWSAADGKLLKAWTAPSGEVEVAAFSPSGQWLAFAAGGHIHWWNAKTWEPEGLPAAVNFHGAIGDPDDVVSFVCHEDVVIARAWNLHGVSGGRPVGQAVCIRGEAKAHDLTAASSDGQYVLMDDGRVFSLKPFKQLAVPAGRLFPDEARRANSGSRFAVLDYRLFDLEAEKPLGVRFNAPPPPLVATSHPDFAFAFVTLGYWESGRFHSQFLVPAPEVTDGISNESLLLWAKVLSRGEINPATGMFEAHEESVWEANRRQLLARETVPRPFPFPGPATHDAKLWLRLTLKDGDKSEKLLPLADRLVAAEPTWQNYLLRGRLKQSVSMADALRDAIASYKASGPNDGDVEIDRLGDHAALTIISDAKRPRAEYILAQHWLDLFEDGGHDFQFTDDVLKRALVHYRLGHYQESLKQIKRIETRLASYVAAGLSSPWALLELLHLNEQGYLVDKREGFAPILEAMCHHKLGNAAAAKTSLARARKMFVDYQVSYAEQNLRASSYMFEKVVREALDELEPEKK